MASRLARRYARRSHDLLRERLRSLDACRPRARAEDEEPEAAQRVRQPEDERQLRPDHDEVDLERARQAEQPLGVFRADRMARRHRGDAWIPRSGVELGEAG